MFLYRTFEFSRVFVFSALFNFQDTLFRAFPTFSSRSHCLFIISYFLEFVKSFFLYFSELLTYSLQSNFSFPEKYFKTCFSQSAYLLYHIFLCLSSFFEFFFSANLLTENFQISLTCLSLEATWLLYHIVLCLSSLFLSFFRRFYSPSRLWYTAFTFRPSRKISALLFKAWELIFPRFYLTGWHRSPASFGDLIIISQYVVKCNTECCINIEGFSQGFMWKCN